MIKLTLLTFSAIACGLILVFILVTGFGTVSALSTTTSWLLGLGIATAIAGMLMRDDCGPGRRCF